MYSITRFNWQVEAESEFDDFENNLRALERLDRSSPDLWPEQIPGFNQFIPNTPGTNASSPGRSYISSLFSGFWFYTYKLIKGGETYLFIKACCSPLHYCYKIQY